MNSPGPWVAPESPATAPGLGDGGPSGVVTPPEEIKSAWVLWLCAAGTALLGMLLNAATTSFGDLPIATRDALRDAVDSAGATAASASGGADAPQLTVESVFGIAVVIGAVAACVVAALTVWLAFRLLAGKGWARTLLDVASIFLVVDALSVVIGVIGGVAVAGERGEVLSFVVFALQIVAGLCAATAVWRQHLPAATDFTRAVGGSRAGK